MSQRLLRKSRSNQGDHSQSISHTSPVYHDEQIKNFRIEFSDLSRKRLSDSGEIKDPTIYSHRKSRLSQFSQINRQREISEHKQLTGVTKQYQKWKELSGLPKHTNMQQIIITFLNKLKNNANIWDQVSFLQENYLQNPPKMQDSHMWYIRQSFQYIRQISYFTVALSANEFMNIWIQAFIIIILISEFIDSIIKFRAIKVMLVCNLTYIICTLILNFEISLQVKQSLLIISSLGVINSYQWNLITYISSFCNYINYFANLRLIFLNEGSYIESIIWAMNNCLPFSTIETTNYDEQVMTIIIQGISFFLQIFFIAIIVKNFFSVDEVNIFTTYLKNNKVNQHLIDEAQDILILNTHPNSLQIIHNLFSQLPYTLQKPLFALIKSKRLKEIAFFTRYFSQESIDGLANEGVLKFYTANQIIVEKGELNELIYVVLQGEACVYDKDVFLQNLPMNQAIGIENLLSNQGHNMTIRCKGSSIVISLTHTQFINVIKKKKFDLEAYHSIKNELLFQHKFEILCQSCYICGSKQHLSSNCNRVHSLLNKQIVISRFLHSTPCQRRKIERRWETRVNSLYNLKLVRSCGMRYKKNYGIIPTDSQDEVEEEEEVDYYGRLSYKDLSNPSRVTSSNIEKQKSVEIVSGQTLKDIIYHDHIDNEEQLQYYQQLWQQQQEINRHPVVKQTIQTAGFQSGGDDLYFGEAGINLPLQHKTFTQNSNTFKSSSGQYSANTYQSQKSQQIKQQQQQQQQQTQQQTQQQSTHQSKTYVQSPLGTNQLLVANNRNAQPKLTFSYDPFYYEQGKAILPAPQPEYSTMLRPQYRSQTNYIPSGGQQLPIVSEESSSSQLNLPFVNMPYASAMSISSVGISSIDDAVQRREQQNNTYTGVRRMTQKQTNTNTHTNTMVSAVSPDTKKKSISGSNSRSYSALSSRQNQHYSDLDNVLNRIELKDNFDIDQVEIYNQFKPQNNYDCVVNQFKIQTNKLIRKKKRQK